MQSVIVPPQDSVEELVHYRTINAKVFKLTSGANKLIAVPGRVHVPGDPQTYMARGYPDWQDVDVDFRRTASGFEVVNAWYEGEVQGSSIGWRYRSKIQGEVTIQLAKISGRPVASLNLNIRPELLGNRLLYRDLRPGLDLEIVARPAGLYANKIIHRPVVDREFEWVLEWSDDSPLMVNTATQGRDNYNRQGRQTERQADRVRKLEMQHEVVDVPGSVGHQACRFTERWTGRTWVRDAERRLVPSSDCVYPVWIDQDIIEPIQNTLDDGYESDLPAFVTGNNLVFFGDYAGYVYYNFTRFLALNMPQAATIVLAELKMLLAPLYNAGNNMTIYGYDTDSAVQWSSPTVMPSNVARTTAAVPAVLTTVGAKTFDVTTIVQEIVDRPGWAPGNNLSLFFALPTTGGNNGGYFEDYTAAGSNEPVLEITFNPPAVTNIVQRTMPGIQIRNQI